MKTNHYGGDDEDAQRTAQLVHYLIHISIHRTVSLIWQHYKSNKVLRHAAVAQPKLTAAFNGSISVKRG